MPPCPVPAACDHSQGVALPNRLTHTAGSINVEFQHNFLSFLARVLRSAGRSVVKNMIQFRSRKTPPYGCKPFVSYSLDQFLILSIHHDFLDHFCLKLQLQVSPCWTQHQQEPNYKVLSDATMVLAQDTWFGRRSDSPVLKFWRRESSPNERDAESSSEPVNHPNCCSFVRLNRYVATQTEVVQN